MTSPQRAQSRWWQRLRKPLLVVGLTYVFVVVLCVLFEDWLIYHPLSARRFWGQKPDPRIEDLWSATPDGTKVHAWWLPAAKSEAGAVIYCHGNGGNVSGLGHYILNLQQALDGAGVLALDYPGYGLSEGTPTEEGCNHAAEAFWNVLTQDKKIEGKKIVLIGESLGGGVVADLATRTEPRAVVLLRTYTTLPAVAKDRYPFLPTQWLMRTRFDTLSKLGKLTCPVFIAHGMTDSLILPKHAERLFAAARDPKTLYLMDGLGHNDALSIEFYAKLREFLAGPGRSSVE